MEEKKIYAVMFSYYSDWTIYGYFTSRDDAEKYCIQHKNEQLYVKEIQCYDSFRNSLPEMSMKYQFTIWFNRIKNNWVINDEMFNWEYYCEFYNDEFLRSNKIKGSGNVLTVFVNIDTRDLQRAQKVAQDLLYQLLEEYDGNPSVSDINRFNRILSRGEDERKEEKARIDKERKEKIAEEKLRQKELEELKRLKEKYET